jgi:hypothetical protein
MIIFYKKYSYEFMNILQKYKIVIGNHNDIALINIG